MRRKFLAGGLALLTTAVVAPLAGCSKPAEKAAPKAETPVAKPVAPPPPPPQPDKVTVSLMTDKGEIVIELYAKQAPITTANFLHYLDLHKFDGATFWRSSNSGANGFVQAAATGLTLPPIAHESTKKTGLSHTNGAISMSRYAVGTAQNEFILCVGDNTFLDAGHDPKGDNEGYAVFGYVVKGMDVVRAILHGKIDKHTPPGGWAGQMLAKPVVITKAQRVAAAAQDAQSAQAQ